MQKKLLSGKIVKISGPVVDVRFPHSSLPYLLNALTIELKNGKKLYLEVAQHIGNEVVRTISMGPTEGLYRGQVVENLGTPISVTVGKGVLGRMFNVIGEPIDEKPIDPKIEK